MSLNLTTLMSKNQRSIMKHYLETELGQVMMMRSLMTAAAVREHREQQSTKSSTVRATARESTLSPPPLPSPVRVAVSRESTASPPTPPLPSPVRVAVSRESTASPPTPSLPSPVAPATR